MSEWNFHPTENKNQPNKQITLQKPQRNLHVFSDKSLKDTLALINMFRFFFLSKKGFIEIINQTSFLLRITLRHALYVRV